MTEKIYEFLESKPQFCEDIQIELKCQLCHNLMVRPTFLPCGCEYCYKCLWNYLTNKTGFCVGSRKLCKSRVYCTDDISENPATNRKIMMLRVKCVYNGCNIRSNLEDIVDHIDYCDWGKQECSFVKYGCNENHKMKEDELKDHMSREQVKHISLIFTTIEDMKADHGLLKNQVTELTNENNELKLTNEGLKKNVAVLTSKNEEWERKTERILESMNGFRDELREIRNTRLTDQKNVKNSINSNTNQLVKLNDSQKLIESKLVGVENSYRSMSSITDRLSNNYDELKNKFERTPFILSNVDDSESDDALEVQSNFEYGGHSRQKQRNCLSTCSGNMLNTLITNNEDDDDLPYTWDISYLRHKLNKFPIYWSPKFSIGRGTKIQMGLQNDSISSDLKIVIKLVPGCQRTKQSINVAVINQDTDKFYTACKFNINENSPCQMERIFQKDILKNALVVRNNKLVLKCFSLN